MKSLRFASVVAKSGKPDVHLMLIDPAKDAALQKAIKAGRVMTVHQSRNTTDYGTIGFEKNAPGQILVFPKSLKPFEGARIVGVKYELLEDAAPPRAQRPRISKPAKKRKTSEAASPEPPPNKVVHFPSPTRDLDEDDPEIADLKSGIRHAMQMLEQGKPVAALHLLKRLVT
jgi:hypothetical protein